MTTRLEPETRKEQILTAAVELAIESHYMLVTQSEIAKALDISPSLILAYFSTMDELRYAIIRKAIDTGVKQVILQASSMGRKLAHTIPPQGGLR